MAGPFLGGLLLVRADWVSVRALAVQFSSSYGSSYQTQLYAGRTLIGVTTNPADRRIVGHLNPSAWPEELQLLAVEPASRLTEYGSLLPERPYNRVRLQFAVSGYPADAQYLDVLASDAPGEAVNASNRIERIRYDIDRTYTVLTDPLPGSGEWNFEVAGRDGRPLDGNAGTALELSASVLAHPPDISRGSSTRFSLSVDTGTATATFSY